MGLFSGQFSTWAVHVINWNKVSIFLISEAFSNLQVGNWFIMWKIMKPRELCWLEDWNSDPVGALRIDTWWLYFYVGTEIGEVETYLGYSGMVKLSLAQPSPELCLKVGTCLFWIHFKVEAQTWTCGMFKIQRPPVQVRACSWNSKPKKQILVFFEAWYWRDKVWLLTKFFICRYGIFWQCRPIESSSKELFMCQIITPTGHGSTGLIVLSRKNWEVLDLLIRTRFSSFS